MLTLQWSIPNQVWFVMFGNTLTDINGERMFDTLDNADSALKSVGLKRKPTNNKTVYEIVLETENS